MMVLEYSTDSLVEGIRVFNTRFDALMHTYLTIHRLFYIFTNPPLLSISERNAIKEH